MVQDGKLWRWVLRAQHSILFCSCSHSVVVKLLFVVSGAPTVTLDLRHRLEPSPQHPTQSSGAQRRRAGMHGNIVRRAGDGDAWRFTGRTRGSTKAGSGQVLFLRCRKACSLLYYDGLCCFGPHQSYVTWGPHALPGYGNGIPTLGSKGSPHGAL